MKAKCLMIQGTASSVGKSLLVTALCRIFRRRGVSVAPFKSQNMSLNSFITAEGHEIGRAQAVQAEAAGLAPTSLMNPVLLKPSSDHSSQVIVNGRIRATLAAREYHRYRQHLREDVRAAYEQLAGLHDLVIIEGAGSPAEINLREHDLANMGMAAIADTPVLLVGDIDRGGVFAALYGTVALLEEEERRRVHGVIINKFRGDAAILEPGLRRLETLLRLPALGVLPYLDVRIDEEDSLSERLAACAAPFSGSASAQNASAPADIEIAVIRLPRLSNYTDFAVFDSLPDTSLRFVSRPEELAAPDLLILPGTKNTIEDLRFLHRSGLAERILFLRGQGTPLIGICGGFQMLGARIRDPLGVESQAGEITGLGLLDMETVFAPHKRSIQRSLRVCREAAKRGLLRGTADMLLSGYEIHMGQSRPNQKTEDGQQGGKGRNAAAIPFGRGPEACDDGLVSPCGLILGSYLHGLFDNLAFTRVLINNLRARKDLAPLPQPERGYEAFRQREYDKLADMVERHLDMEKVRSIINDWPGTL